MAETAAEIAYAKAVELVDEVRRKGGTEISFDTEEFRALERIPEGLAGMLAGIRPLRLVDLSNTKVSDLAPIAAMTELQSLWLNRTKVSNLAPIAALTGLRTLSLNQTGVSDLAPIAALTGLRTLSLNQTVVSDLAPIAALTGLQTLSLDQTGVSDLAPIAVLTGLQALRLRQTWVSDLRPIRAARLDSGASWAGLAFSDTPATRLDPELARLAAIEDSKDRTQQTLTYLKTLPPWPEPLPYQVARFPRDSDRIDELSHRLALVENRDAPDRAEIARLIDEAENLRKRLTTQTDLMEAADAKARRAEEALDAFRNRLEEFERVSAEKISKVEDDYKKSMASAEKAFTEANRIKEPVKLWAEKQVEHHRAMRWRGIGFGVSIVVSMLVACGVIYGLITYGSQVDGVFTPIACDRAKPETCNGFTMRGLLATGSILTILTLLLWFARLQMKLFLAERHLALDARERAAFAQTYVGLLNEAAISGDAGQAKDQHAMVYAALFRPSVDGTVKEEGGLDPAITAALSKLLTK